MTAEIAGVIDGVTTPAYVQRRAHQALAWGRHGAFAGGVGARNGWAHGVVWPTDLKVTQTPTPGMAVQVASGLSLITGTVSAEQGPYSYCNPSAVTRTIAPADSVNARRDLVIAQIVDPAYAGAAPEWDIVVVQGTPSSSPTDPSLAGHPNALVLARVTVPANATAITSGDITDLRAMGGPLAGMPTCQVVAATFPVPHNEFVSAPFTQAQVDYFGWWSASSPARVTPTIPGWYRCLFQYNFANSNQWLRIAGQVRKNGARVWATEENPHTGTVDGTECGTGPLIHMNGTTDYFEFALLQTNNSSETRNADATLTVELAFATPA